MKGVARIAAVSLATLMAAALLWNFRGAAVLLVLSLVVAAALRPLVEAVEPRLGRGFALAVTYTGVLGVLGVFFYIVSHSALREIEDGIDLLTVGYERLRATGEIDRPIHGFIVRRLPPAAEIYQALGAARLSAVLHQLLGVTMNLLDIAGRCLIVVALSIYWSARHESFERLWMSLVPAAHRTRAREIWRAVESGVGAHVRSDLGQSLLTALLLGVTFHLAALHTPMMPALAAGLFRLVPFVGALIAALFAFAAGNVTSLYAGIAAAGYALLVVVLLDRWFASRVFHARRFSPTLVVFLIVALVDAYGILGVLIASPLAAAIQIFVERLIATHPRRSRHAQTLADIETRLIRVSRGMRHVRPDQAAELGSMLARLTALVVEARRSTAQPLGAAVTEPASYNVDAPVARANAAAATLRSNTDWR